MLITYRSCITFEYYVKVSKGKTLSFYTINRTMYWHKFKILSTRICGIFSLLTDLVKFMNNNNKLQQIR